MPRMGEVRVLVDPKALKEGQGPLARAHLAALGHLDGAADR